MSDCDLFEQLRAFEGRESGPPMVARDAVNQAMIRHWTDAMGDTNPVYVDEDAARANGFGGIVAPPTMLQAWIMRGYRYPEPAPGEWSAATNGTPAIEQLWKLLVDAGYSSVVATDCSQEYVRPLVIGDRLTVTSVIEQVSPEKHTALGDGHFVTTRMDYTDQNGAPVATMRFRVLRFRPRQVAAPPAQVPRPRPAITHDNAFFFEGLKEGKLLVQRCTSCGLLRHPPRPACPRCRAFDWDTVEASGRGTVFSYVVVHHPQVPGFDYPLPIAVVELEEGTRLVADLVGVEPDDVHVGMPVVVDMVAVDDELTLAMFKPDPAVAGAAAPGGAVAGGAAAGGAA
ncbi:MAG TPA: bifunctional MaoC family dehydratase N-terminal/OB-fold nucleic acid binding domain-containing protein [Acidimicrobiales bacterium]|nr:bifunctional MaoC family dehydratase N-terminal/OB-fold nucleic acid binding domain-containing protein [Acidimicrobiales bacterium]